jgi:dipeptidase E
MTGGADSEHFNIIDKKFISLLGENPTLLFIPLAAEDDNFVNGLTRIKETFSTIQFNNIEMCIDLHKLNWKYLSKFNAIYFDGGNTFNLMEKIRDTHTYELLHKFIHSGGIVNGDSAGAIVLGSHLETAHFGELGDNNDTSVISYQGLNLLGNISIHCHYQEDGSENIEIQNFSNEYGFPVIALHENSALYIDGKVLEVIGENKIDIYRAFELPKSIRPNEKINLSSFII